MLTRRNLLGSLIGAVAALLVPKVKAEPHFSPSDPAHCQECWDEASERLAKAADPWHGDSPLFSTRRYVVTELHRNSAGELVPIDVERSVLVYDPHKKASA